MKCYVSDKTLFPDENDELPVNLFLELLERGEFDFVTIKEGSPWGLNYHSITAEELKENHMGEIGFFRREWMEAEYDSYGNKYVPYITTFCVWKKK